MTDRWRQATVPLAALLTLTFASSAAAQLNEAGAPIRPPGWSVTPSALCTSNVSVPPATIARCTW